MMTFTHGMHVLCIVHAGLRFKARNQKQTAMQEEEERTPASLVAGCPHHDLVAGHGKSWFSFSWSQYAVGTIGIDRESSELGRLTKKPKLL